MRGTSHQNIPTAVMESPLLGIFKSSPNDLFRSSEDHPEAAPKQEVRLGQHKGPFLPHDPSMRLKRTAHTLKLLVPGAAFPWAQLSCGIKPPARGGSPYIHFFTDLLVPPGNVHALVVEQRS